MHGKHEAGRRGALRRRSLAVIITVAILCSLLPVGVAAFATGVPSEYLCGHVHDSSCGYVQGSAGTPCNHVHDAARGCTEGAPCAYVHSHNEVCGYCEGSPCTYAHSHDETCGFNAETGEGCTDVHTHDGTCGYSEAAPCADVHVHDAACGYIEASACNHVHDASCGYSEPVAAVPCGHVCNIIAFDGYTPGTAVSCYEAAAGAEYDSICAALPKTLKASLACSGHTADVPVTWSCAEYIGAAGTYTFRAALTNTHCANIMVDDPATADINESELPFIAVTVPEVTAAVTLSPSPSPTSAPSPSLAPPTTLTSGAVTVTGILPEGAYLLVTEVPIADAQELLGETETNTVVLFAYDIKIMLPGALDGETGEYGQPTEYQPGAENPVTVAISPLEPIEVPTVEVLHIAKDESGNIMTQPVEDVTTTENSVEFEAEGFSVYVVTMGTYTPRVTFSYDDESLDVQYSTDNLTYIQLTSDVSVAVGTTLYFKVTGGSVTVYRDGNTTTPMTAGANSVYTVDSITANTIIAIIGGSNVTFDVGKGPIVIGGDAGSGGRNYTGYDSTGTHLTGVHVPGKIYTITGSTGSSDSGGGYNVTLTGEGDFNVVLSNVTIYTGTPGGPYEGIGGCAPVSTSGVTAGNINITLDGTNTLANVSKNTSDSYAALEKTDNDSTLIINGSGVLYATGGADSAGIGSSDSTSRGTKNITINSGTITATAIDSQGAGIGSGNNQPAENIRIYGGNITAIGFDNGAGIGGSGSATFTANTGEVYIYGGTINATSNGKGAGIGGGGSGTGDDAKGGAGEVYIYGGTITADSIGGGYGGNSGGAATVTISGGKVTTYGSIGGGDSAQGIGGEATITISGGTVVTPHISGGKNSDGTYKDATVSIAAASVNIADRSNINSVTGPDPNNDGMPTVVYCQTIDIDDVGFTGGSGNIVIQSAGLDDGVTYDLTDVYPDSENKLYFWLPTEYHVTSLTINGEHFDVTDDVQTPIATITHDSSTVGTTLGAVLNVGTPSAYQWQISNDNALWADISGATAQTYTTTSADLDKYVRVVITTGGVEVTSGSLRITDAPYAYISYETLEAPGELTAQLLGGTGGTYTYRWQMYNSEQYVDIPNATNQTLSITENDIGKRIRVIITDSDTQYTQYTTSYVVVHAPQISVTIPTEMVVTVNAAGACSVPQSTIINNSDKPVRVTNVTFAWVTSGGNDANELFHRYTDVTATLTLGGTKHEFTGIAPTLFSPTATAGGIIAKSGGTPGELPLEWAFTLGSGNYLNLAPAMGAKVRVATVTYTVAWADTQ